MYYHIGIFMKKGSIVISTAFFFIYENTLWVLTNIRKTVVLGTLGICSDFT